MLVQSQVFAEPACDQYKSSRLTVASLCKSYVGRGAVLQDVSFNVDQGETVALIGGNGSGKSTLLRCCLRFIEPDQGKIVFLERNINQLKKNQLRTLRSRIGLVFQRHNLVPRLTVLTNVIHGPLGRQPRRPDIRRGISAGGHCPRADAAPGFHDCRRTCCQPGPKGGPRGDGAVLRA